MAGRTTRRSRSQPSDVESSTSTKRKSRRLVTEEDVVSKEMEKESGDDSQSQSQSQSRSRNRNRDRDRDRNREVVDKEPKEEEEETTNRQVEEIKDTEDIKVGAVEMETVQEEQEEQELNEVVEGGSGSDLAIVNEQVDKGEEVVAAVAAAAAAAEGVDVDNVDNIVNKVDDNEVDDNDNDVDDNDVDDDEKKNSTNPSTAESSSNKLEEVDQSDEMQPQTQTQDDQALVEVVEEDQINEDVVVEEEEIEEAKCSNSPCSTNESMLVVGTTNKPELEPASVSKSESSINEETACPQDDDTSTRSDGNDDDQNSNENESENESKNENDNNNDNIDTIDSSSAIERESEEEKEEVEDIQDDQNEEGGDDEDEEEEWDLKHVHTIEEISSGKIECMTDNCPLIACVTYVSSLDSTSEGLWHSCLDCQEQDYGGWPDDLAEIPVKFLTKEHREIMTEKCTGRYCPDMPNLPSVDPSKLAQVKKKKGNKTLDSTVSPESTTTGAKSSTDLDTASSDEYTDVNADDDNTTTCDITKTTKTKPVAKTVSAVTPPPGKRQHTATSISMHGNNTINRKTTSASTKVTPIPPARPSSHALAVHKKWQDAAKAMGGERIVVSKPTAKKLIFNLLKDSFQPMNITDIFKRLKGVVPSPVLKSSLDDMALDTFNSENQFAESDDEDEENKSKATTQKKSSTLNGSPNEDEYAGSLTIKTGRNTNTTLYYCDYSKLSNNGNGLLPDDRNTLLSDHGAAKAELEAKDASTKSMTADSVQLLSEPTNTEATLSLEEVEEHVRGLREQVDAAQEFRGFEKHRIKIRKKVDIMAGQWRRRRRVCMDFLINMEENTDGSVSVKKCLSGDGQIYIESDQVALKGQREFAKNQRKRGLLGKRSGVAKKRQKLNKTSSISGVPPDGSFIGVEMNARGSVERVYVDDEN